VNVAARVESGGSPGHINITDATYNMLDAKYVVNAVHRVISAKGKGLLLFVLLLSDTSSGDVICYLLPPTEFRSSDQELKVPCDHSSLCNLIRLGSSWDQEIVGSCEGACIERSSSNNSTVAFQYSVTFTCIYIIY